MNIRDIYNCATILDSRIDRLNIRANTLVASSLQLIDNIVPELSSNSCYEYLHVFTLSASRADDFMTTHNSFDHNVIP